MAVAFLRGPQKLGRRTAYAVETICHPDEDFIDTEGRTWGDLRPLRENDDWKFYWSSSCESRIARIREVAAHVMAGDFELDHAMKDAAVCDYVDSIEDEFRERRNLEEATRDTVLYEIFEALGEGALSPWDLVIPGDLRKEALSVLRLPPWATVEVRNGNPFLVFKGTWTMEELGRVLDPSTPPSVLALQRRSHRRRPNRRSPRKQSTH